MYPNTSHSGINGRQPRCAKYGSLKLTESSPAQSFTEPVALDEAKAYCNLPFLSTPDAVQDTMLSGLIAAARGMAELAQKRDLVRKRWDLSFDWWPGREIQLRAPLVSVDLVQYRDSSGAWHELAENTDYIVDAAKSPGVIVPAANRTWPSFTPWPSSAVLVRFTSGFAPDDPFWSEAGPTVKVGMKRLVLEWHMNRIPTGVGITELPFAITACLGYRAIPSVR